MKESALELEGNDRYEGFAVDLIIRIADMLGFSYEFEVEKDYGSWSVEHRKWTGMVEILREDVRIIYFLVTMFKKTIVLTRLLFKSKPLPLDKAICDHTAKSIHCIQ